MNIEDVIREHIDYYDAPTVFCETCHKTWPSSWDELPDAQHLAAEHWIAEHDTPTR